MFCDDLRLTKMKKEEKPSDDDSADEDTQTSTEMMEAATFKCITSHSTAHV